MPTWVIVLIVAVAAVIALASALASRRASSRRRTRTELLRDRFGPEYDRLAAAGSAKRAEQELTARQRRHAELDLQPLPAADRSRFAGSWQEVQLSFLDSPTTAVREAEHLVERVMTMHGYPTGTDPAGSVAEVLSVEHARQLDHLREARATSVAATDGNATTEDLRQAMVRFRALFADLLRAGAEGAGHSEDVYPAEPEQRVRVIPS